MKCSEQQQKVLEGAGKVVKMCLFIIILLLSMFVLHPILPKPDEHTR